MTYVDTHTPYVELLPYGWQDTHAEQAEVIRRLKIGASEIPAVLGASPYDSAFSLWCHKRYGWPRPQNEVMRWGRRHEDNIVEEWAWRHPEYEVACCGLLQSTNWPWMLASPDRLVRPKGQSTWLPLECKSATLGASGGWGRTGTDEIPAWVRWQLSQQALVLNGFLGVGGFSAVLLSGSNYRDYTIHLWPDQRDHLLDDGAAFAASLLAIEDTPPPIDDTEHTGRALARLYSPLEPPTPVDEDLHQRWLAAREARKAAKQAFTAVDNQMRAAAGNHRAVFSGIGWVKQICSEEVPHFDVKRFKADHPDLYTEYLAHHRTNYLSPVKEYIDDDS